MNNTSFLPCALLATLAACASAPRAITEGDEEVAVSAQTWKTVPSTVPGQPNIGTVERVEGAQCTLSNDKGTWTAVTPSVVRVQRSSQPLKVRCEKEGYKPAEASVACRSPREIATQRQNIDTAFAMVFVPLGIAAAPIAPQLAAQAGMNALFSGVGAATAQQSLGSDPDLCRYVGVAPTLTAR